MVDFTRDFTMTIDGEAVVGDATIDVINPATEEPVARAPDCSRDQLDAAVAAARAAFTGWRATPIEQRRAAVAKIGEVIGAHMQEFSRLFTLEQGRPLAMVGPEVGGAAFWAQQVSQQELPVTVNEETPNRRSETRHVPIGVVGAIVPWNFPLMIGIWKIAGALLTGNALVIKPSPYTPLTMLKLGEAMREHLPPGVFNVVSGGDAVGPWITAHPGIDKISFTGSTATGKRVMENASASLKRITLELGGNDAAIVLPDVDVAAIAEPLFWAAFGNSGQVCTAAKRIYVHEDIYGEVATALTALARNIPMGDGLAEGNLLGPVQNRAQFERVKALIAQAKANGETFLTGGEPSEGKGYFIPATIVDNPPEDSATVQEEAFGPLVPLLKYSDVDDAIARANASDYGLAGSVWSNDMEAALAVAERLETGTVWINETLYVMPWTPFAGHKQSGIGVEHGIEGLLEFTVPQTITARKPLVAAPREPATEGAEA
ncbi:aldehyde dehydrogenase family protein [Stakelama tenebrarum]|uniref:Aldehyde dehydrogenase family protein n=1 Tax=Stakelama tenebrarum TaxID=2711215 RepID=A0A6G6Y802_9SPHN|nr:aldehyde dehydrogenase family protein [Sphingosinithalassobacter tenebrarum]QIG81055.1 aldehyde dehydrogenase family protein [Sphingosinithalassobacter tenebrarum]